MVDFKVGDKYGRSGQLEIAEMGEENGNKTVYYLRCSVCSQDEVIGDILHKTTRKSLKAGDQPCMCGGRRHLTEEQQTRRIIKECSIRNLKFEGFTTPYNGVGTYLKLRCLLDGETSDQVSVHSFFKGWRGCITCSAREQSARHRKPDDVFAEGFMKAGAFLEGTKFWRKEGFLSMWNYTCPVCSSDEFVQAGVCDGVFSGDATGFLRGQRACRCTAYRYNAAQREYQINKRIEDEGLNYKFLGWQDGYETSASIALLECEEHGIFKGSAGRLIYGRYLCPLCSGRSFSVNDDAFIYVLKVEGIPGDFAGYGITRDTYSRFRDHRKNLSRDGFSITEHQIFPVKGDAAVRIEKDIKSTFERNPQVVESFKTEAAHCDQYYNIIDFVKSSIASPTLQ